MLTQNHSVKIITLMISIQCSVVKLSSEMITQNQTVIIIITLIISIPLSFVQLSSEMITQNQTVIISTLINSITSSMV
jgi:hypothetical protein